MHTCTSFNFTTIYVYTCATLITETNHLSAYGGQQFISLLFLKLLSETCQTSMDAWFVFCCLYSIIIHTVALYMTDLANSTHAVTNTN